MERLGFFVCSEDLEDELIRALGAASVEAVVDAQGDLGSFRTLQKQPEWRGRSTEEQLRRFMGSGSGRKIRYAPLLVGALDLTRVPRPPDGAEEVPAMLSRLLEAHEMILVEAHDAAAKVIAMGDDGTNDLLVSEVIRTGELQAWLLAEHLVDTPLVQTDETVKEVTKAGGSGRR